MVARVFRKNLVKGIQKRTDPMGKKKLPANQKAGGRPKLTILFRPFSDTTVRVKNRE